MPRLADCLAALVEGLGNGLVREAIVVDGGSSDATAQLAADMGCRVIGLDGAQRGRANQLQCGADAAIGDWLLFLHADTVLAPGWSGAVARHLEASDIMKAAYFQLGFDTNARSGNRVAALANWRARLLGLPYGDAGLLISRAFYCQIGGFRAMALMEDVDLVSRIGRKNLVDLEVIATTAATKFERGGWWAVPMRNLALVIAFKLGVNPAKLAGWYK